MYMNVGVHVILQVTVTIELKTAEAVAYWGCSVKKTFSKISQHLQQKHLCQSLFFNKASGLQFYFKKIFCHRCFSVNFCEIFKSTFFIEHLFCSFFKYLQKNLLFVNKKLLSEAALQRCSQKNYVLTTCSKFTGEHQCPSVI